MIGSVKLIPSGFSIIDDNWGGIYRGGSYLVIGPKKSGRSLLALQYTREAVNNNEVCLYFTNMRARDLMIQAASINFDIQNHMNEENVIVVRIASPDDLYNLSNVDNYLIEYMNDIISVVGQYNPSRIVFDELTPYVGFTNLDMLRDSFRHTVEVIEDQEITSFYILGEPATARAKSVVDMLAQQVTGVIYLKRSMEDEEKSGHAGTVEIIPNVGHPQGEFSDKYKIIPNEGLVIVNKEVKVLQEKEVADTFDELDKNEKIEKAAGKSEKKEEIKSEPKQNLRSVKIRPAELNLTKETIGSSSTYNSNDFILLLNNQIALYRSTGQLFNLVSLKLDPAAQVKGYLNSEQLINTVTMSATRKDKVMADENKILTLLVNSDENDVQKFISNIPKNLPSTDDEYIKTVLSYISVVTVEVDNNVENGEVMLNFILSAAMNDKFQKLSSLEL